MAKAQLYQNVRPAAIFCSLIAFCTAGSYSILRWGLNSVGPSFVASSLGLSLFFLHFPYLIRRTWGDAGISNVRWYKTPGALLIWGVLLTFTVGMIKGEHLLPIGVVFAFGGYVLFIFHLADFLRQPQAHPRFLTAFLALLFSMWCSVYLFSTIYHNPLFLESILTGRAFIDTLMHISHAQMIRTFGESSSGLNGPVFIPYHVGSHYWFVSISRLLDCPLPVVYNLIYPVAVVPLLIYSILSFAETIRGEDTSRDARTWIILLLSFVGCLPIVANSRTTSFSFKLISESYVVAVLFSFLFLSMAVAFFRRERVPSFRFENQIVLWILVPLGFWMLSWTKISIPFLMLPLYGWMILRRFRTSLTHWISLVLSAAVMAWSYPMIAGDQAAQFSLFHFFRVYVDDAWKPLYIPIYYFWLLIYFFLAARALKIKSFGDVIQTLRDQRWLAGELVFWLAFVGALPGIFFAISGANALYFSGVQQYGAIALLIAMESPTDLPGKDIAASKRKKIILGIIAIPFIVCTIFNWAFRFKEAFNRNVEIRESILTQAGMPPAHHKLNSRESYLRLTKGVKEVLRQSERWKLLRFLVDLSRQPREVRKQSLIYIPLSNRVFWDLPFQNCEGLPFVGPALSGHAVLAGIDPKACHVDQIRCFDRYDLKAIEAFQENYSERLVGEQAAAMGFQKVLVINSDVLKGIDLSSRRGQ